MSNMGHNQKRKECARLKWIDRFLSVQLSVSVKSVKSVSVKQLSFSTLTHSHSHFNRVQ